MTASFTVKKNNAFIFQQQKHNKKYFEEKCEIFASYDFFQHKLIVLAYFLSLFRRKKARRQSHGFKSFDV